MTENKKKDPSQSSEFVKATRSQKKGAKEILRLGQKVYDYRKDILSAADADNLQSANLCPIVIVVYCQPQSPAW